MNSVYSVSQINSYIKRMFDADILLGRVSVQGEVSNCKYHNSGHIYFTLKDGGAELQCMMFRGNVRAGLTFNMRDGDKVTALGRISVYEKNGTYRLIAAKIEKDGTGSLYEKYLKLKEELEECGLFAPEYKKEMPRICRRLGVVTAPDGAAIRDIINISKRRNPGIEIFVYPAKVQGEGAAASICQGLRTLDAMGLDVIIAGRGGGSIEDLWAFNEESVARAIFACGTPVVSAVGHETDFTIADFVADLRAPTPSAAAELAVGDMLDLIETVEDYGQRLARKMNESLLYKRRLLSNYEDRIKYLSPENVIKNRRENLRTASEKLSSLIGIILERNRHLLELNVRKMEAYSPLKKLSGGYAYITSKDGSTLTSVTGISEGEEFTVDFKDGSVKARAEEVNRSEKWQSRHLKKE